MAMRRLVLGLILVACAVAPASASAAPELTAEFKLPTSAGFAAEVNAYDNQIILTIRRGTRSASYLVRGELTETGIDAQFGRLGRISFDFQPSETEEREPPAGCRGKPATVMQGTFAGEAKFRGEGGYATIEVSRVKGQLEVEPGLRCSERRPLARRGNREVGALRAFDRHGGRYLLAIGNTSATGFYEAGFLANVVERDEGMTIDRAAGLGTKRRGLFVYDHQAGTATVRPPAPFRGEAHFTRQGNASRPGSWRGDLSVSLLGHPPVALTGPTFRTTLNRKPPYFR